MFEDGNYNYFQSNHSKTAEKRIKVSSDDRLLKESTKLGSRTHEIRLYQNPDGTFDEA